MQNTGKKLHLQACAESCFSMKDVESKINTTEKNVGKRYYTKRYKPIQRPQVKAIGSILSKRRGSEFSSNGTRNGKQIRRKTVQKVSDTNSYEKPLSSILHGGKFSLHRRDTGGDPGTRKVDRWRKRKRRKEKREQDYVEKVEDDNRKVKRRRKRKRKESREQDEASRLQRRTRYLLIKMKLEQNLIDAYSGEGWKGQSREKIKPVRELQRAKKQILKCKLGIRDAIHQLDLLGSEGCIEQSVLGPDGSVFHEHIFCAKCKSREAFRDNDIILCDGTCNCAFHQKCLEPPLATENIPPGDQGWFCKFCECKIEILEAVNAHTGTHFSTNSSWQEIFEEAAMGPDGENASLNPEDEWPSDESDDDDYDPERNEISCSFSRSGDEDNKSDEASSSSSFFWTSDEEATLQSRRLENNGSPEGGYYQGKEREKHSYKINFGELMDDINSDGTTDREIKSRRRQRRAVDYKKLHDEMFGKDVFENEQVSEDEDWGPSRRRGKLNETVAAGTLVTLCGNEDSSSDGVATDAKKKLPSVSRDKRTLFRIPPNAVVKLRRIFAENELPSRAVKENLSKQLGIASEKINKWFKNARYSALKIRKADGGKEFHTTGTIAKESTAAAGNNRTMAVVSSDNEGVQIPISLRKVRRRKNPKSSTISSNKKQHKRIVEALPNNINKVDFNKKLPSLKRKATIEENKIEPTKYELVQYKKTEELYLTEMERLCHLEAKLAEMKAALLRIYNEKSHVTDQIRKDEPNVVYVPVAEVRVKG